ncbi:hypothetical protein AZI85_12240 [Bdellovibrio bacteriovorus]|uniref:Uncharacterized protein n=1 Tax=Bdellovibrio bacteriovorus TaxID=959 RepID=A0A150WCR7_BDEBC|nr:hypothetical protein [Bdellovibrio bacteriovorus]KYG60753.1 hypothetical protein AZI85_12240 [Bdellovibrio bacteriovorus]
MTLRLLSLIISALLIQACSFKKDDGEASPAVPANSDVIETIQKEQEKQAFEGKLTEQNVSVKFEETPDPLGYKMVISWPEEAKRVQISINGKVKKIYNSTDLQSSHSEVVSSGENFEITLIAFDSLGMAPYSALTLVKTAPTDFVVSKPLELTESRTIEINGRFYFLKNGKIKTNGHNLSIKAKKLIIESDDRPSALFSSHIVTRFPGESMEEPHEVSGSTVLIRASLGKGHLQVSMVGGAGKDGLHGNDLEAVMGVESAKNGLDGLAGTTTKVSKPCPRRLGIDAPPCEGETTLCVKPPENGQPGKDGTPGRDGQNGQDGGSTGNLTIFIEDQTEFSAYVFQRKGLPGKGGKGAPGHPGGIGGSPGANPAPCPPAAKGADGKRGPDGKDGLDGAPGLLGEIFHNIKNIYVEKQ